MYISQDIAERINFLLKSKKIQQKTMLEECGLNKNSISTMLSRGSMLKADSLAKIADYLDCSVDYLLGRTDIPTIQENDLKTALFGNADNITDEMLTDVLQYAQFVKQKNENVCLSVPFSPSQSASAERIAAYGGGIQDMPEPTADEERLQELLRKAKGKF